MPLHLKAYDGDHRTVITDNHMQFIVQPEIFVCLLIIKYKVAEEN